MDHETPLEKRYLAYQDGYDKGYELGKEEIAKLKERISVLETVLDSIARQAPTEEPVPNQRRNYPLAHTLYVVGRLARKALSPSDND